MFLSVPQLTRKWRNPCMSVCALSVEGRGFKHRQVTQGLINWDEMKEVCLFFLSEKTRNAQIALLIGWLWFCFINFFHFRLSYETGRDWHLAVWRTTWFYKHNPFFPSCVLFTRVFLIKKQKLSFESSFPLLVKLILCPINRNLPGLCQQIGWGLFLSSMTMPQCTKVDP